jgi:hypothetical protein
MFQHPRSYSASNSRSRSPRKGNKGGKGRKGKDRKGSRSRSPSFKGGGKGVCYDFQNKGSCRFGTSCRYRHEGAGSSPQFGRRSNSSRDRSGSARR